jgi:hypothetical protein
MEYLKVDWHHDSSYDPCILLSELDEDRMEVRKVEIFKDGVANWADASGNSGDTQLGMEPIPSIEEIGSDPQFTPKSIDRQEFEASWRLAKHSETAGQ